MVASALQQQMQSHVHAYVRRVGEKRGNWKYEINIICSQVQMYRIVKTSYNVKIVEVHASQSGWKIIHYKMCFTHKISEKCGMLLCFSVAEASFDATTAVSL